MRLRNRGLNNIPWTELALMMFLFYDYISGGISWIMLGVSGMSTGLIRMFLLGITGTVMIISALKCYRRIKSDTIFVFFLFSALYIISYAISENNAYEIMRQGLIKTTLLECCPVYLLFRILKDKQRLWRIGCLFSYALLILYVVAFLVYDVGHVYRTYSAGLILAASIFMIEWLFTENESTIAPTIISIILIIIGGRRSSLVSILILFVLICIVKEQYKYIIGGMALFALLYLLWTPIINLLLQTSLRFGINSRVLRRILAGSLGEDSHRYEQWAYVFELIFSNIKRTIFGLGIAGERFYLLNHFSHMQLQGYPHGILVEMIGHFGILIGPFMESLLFIKWPIRAFKESPDNTTKILLFSIALVSALLFQDSYLQNKYFFLYLAVLADILYHGFHRRSKNA